MRRRGPGAPRYGQTREGYGSHLVDRVNVSAFLRPQEQGDNFGDTDPQSRFSALRGDEILTCEATRSNSCEDPGRGLREVAQKAALDAGVPRPLAPQLNFGSFEVRDTNATHVQLCVISNQCTGTPEYQGEQDANPLNETDCDENSTNPTQGKIVRAADLKVFSR